MEYLLAIVIFGVYFVPSIVSYGNKNHDSVLAINLFWGWTLFGWVIAFSEAMAVSNADNTLLKRKFNEEL